MVGSYEYSALPGRRNGGGGSVRLAMPMHPENYRNGGIWLQNLPIIGHIRQIIGVNTQMVSLDNLFEPTTLGRVNLLTGEKFRISNGQGSVTVYTQRGSLYSVSPMNVPLEAVVGVQDARDVQAPMGNKSPRQVSELRAIFASLIDFLKDQRPICRPPTARIGQYLRIEPIINDPRKVPPYSIRVYPSN